jgi:methionyl-tRNA synthetase
MDDKDNILVTTAISYANSDPHIGHFYESIIADFINGVYKIMGNNSKLLTGTDEHGKKIQEAALLKNMSSIELCNKYSKSFVDMNELVDNSVDYFIRTTEESHVDMVKRSIENIKNSDNHDDIYLSEYEGYYNTREEHFVTEHEAKTTDYVDPINNKPYDIVKEETYKFKLNKYQENINSIIDLIVPSGYKDDIKARLANIGDLDDLSITRLANNVSWGIPFPLNESHTIYVWFDALLNYVTGKKILFGDDECKMIHVIGKDITWFHAIIYPAILSSCNYNDLLPTKIIVHGFILDKYGIKMSKSIGNVISINDIIPKYSVDMVRYYLLSNTNLGSDLKFDVDMIQINYNNLINGFGNLFQRLRTLSIPIINEINNFCTTNGELIIVKKQMTRQKILPFFDKFDFQLYNGIYNDLIDKLNKDITEKQVWKLDVSVRPIIIYDMIIDLNIIMCLLKPIIPTKIKELSCYFGWEHSINLESMFIINIIEPTKKIKAFEK